ncbi:hypothetical protein D3C73_1511210 [compost metagenome]
MKIKKPVMATYPLDFISELEFLRILSDKAHPAMVTIHRASQGKLAAMPIDWREKPRASIKYVGSHVRQKVFIYRTTRY